MMSKLSFIFLLVLGAFAPSYASEVKTAFVNEFSTKVLDAIDKSQDIPGLKADEFISLKADIKKTWLTLTDKKVLEITGTDKDVRPHFVTLQAIVEHLVDSQLGTEINSLVGVIHTPMPATPLCTEGVISPDLIDPSIEVDSNRLFTVKARTTILQDYLFKGGDLYIAYPKSGKAKRTQEQQRIYTLELQKNPIHLIDVPLTCDTIPTELVGATYFFENRYGEPFLFSIQMTQAKDPQEKGNFGLWFGPLNDPILKARAFKIFSFLNQYGTNFFSFVN